VTAVPTGVFILKRKINRNLGGTILLLEQNACRVVGWERLHQGRQVCSTAQHPTRATMETSRRFILATPAISARASRI
jgi:hypothetical protein